MARKVTQGLKGKYYLHSGAEHYQTGQIVDQFDGMVLLEQSRPDEHRPLALVYIDELVADYDDRGEPYVNGGTWDFFCSQKELDAYVVAMNTPREEDAKPKVVTLVTTKNS